MSQPEKKGSPDQIVSLKITHSESSSSDAAVNLNSDEQVGAESYDPNESDYGQATGRSAA